MVSKTGKGDEYKVMAAIDFGDTSYSYYVFELAIAMAYMMLESKELSTGGLVIAGYGMIRNIPENERKVLKVRIFIDSFLNYLILNERIIKGMCCRTSLSKFGSWCLQSQFGPRKQLPFKYTSGRVGFITTHMG